MKRTPIFIAVFLSCLLLCVGCTAAPDAQNPAESTSTKRDNIPFADNQLYAVAYLGYQKIENLDFYTEQYLDNDQIPIHYFSDGDYYLIIPRYAGMTLSLYQNDFTTSTSSLVYENPECEPFIIQCNVSDIFNDATIQLTYQEKTAEFSPFRSLKDGSLQAGENGLNLTKGE